MSLNSLKRTIVFSTEEVKSVIEQCLEDRASVSLRSVSSEIEYILVTELLPCNPDAMAWVEFLQKGRWTVGNVLCAAFSFLASGINCKPRYSNGLPLVRYAYTQQSRVLNTAIPENHPTRDHFLGKLDSICEKLEESAAIPEYAASIGMDAKFCRDYYKLECGQYGSILPGMYYNLLISHWDLFKDWSVTYSFLCDLVKRQTDWQSAPRDRLELIDVLKCISNEWKSC